MQVSFGVTTKIRNKGRMQLCSCGVEEARQVEESKEEGTVYNDQEGREGEVGGEPERF